MLYPIPNTQYTTHDTRWAVVLLLIVFVALGITYSIVTPIFEASDELWHYPVVQYIAAGHGLPVQTPPDRPGLWKQEASQAPLYYMLAGLLTSWIDASDLSVTLRPNLHAAIGVVTPDGNINMVAHDPAREGWPWRGTVLAVHIARLLSVAMSAATVYLTYRLGLAVFPDRADIASGAAALTAFTPMFTFISGSVNNDNLATLLCALALLLMIYQARAVGDEERNLLLGWLALGVVIGLATLSKVSGLALLPLAALTGAWVAWQAQDTTQQLAKASIPIRGGWSHGFSRSLRRLFMAGLAIGLPVLLITGWWFWRNLQLYGDLLGMKVFTLYFTRPIPADLAQIWSERTSFLYGYWGNFGGLNLPIPAWAYTLLNGLLIVAGVGLVLALVRWVITILPLVSPITFNLQSTIYNLQSEIRNPKFPLLLVILWGIVVGVSWLTWTRTTWSSQGRLVFYALPCYSILIVAGLAAWLPRRVTPFALSALSVGMVLLAAVMPFAVIAPAYARPPQLTSAQVASIPHRVGMTFGDAMVLLGYDAPTVGASVRPGDSIPITLYWQALKPMERDYSVFVHLLGEHEIEAQDKGPAYPGRGNLPTTTLAPGQTWAETWVVPIEATAFAPDRLTWEVGLYDVSTGVRLAAVDKAGHALGDNVRLGQVTLTRSPGSQYNSVSYNLSDQIELIGFDLDRRAARPGETVSLTLLWRALTAPSRDYTVFVQVLGQQQARWASVDQQPSPHTSQWKPGQTISNTYLLKFNPDTPAGVYELHIGAYYFTSESSLERLKVLTRDGRQQQDHIVLGKLRVAR